LMYPGMVCLRPERCPARERGESVVQPRLDAVCAACYGGGSQLEYASIPLLGREGYSQRSEAQGTVCEACADVPSAYSQT